MSEKECKDIALTPKQQLLIEGYKALMQYGCQMSQDHLSVDRIFMPLSLVPAYFVLTSLDVREAGWPAEVLIWCAGGLLLWFWHSRNKRSAARLNEIWDTLCCIEKCLGFAAYSRVHAALNPDKQYEPKPPPRRDFEVKRIFACIAGLVYFGVFVYLVYRWSTC